MAFPLNPGQRAAVQALRGRVLISAGAGSGKTRTLVERFAAALADSEAEEWSAVTVSQVLAITFTDKAAGELSERVRSALRSVGRLADSRAVDGAWICTIHGLCSRTLRRYALEAGLDPAFGIADAVEAGILKESAFEAAAHEALGTSDGERLFGAFEFGPVFGAIEAVTRELRTRGLSAAALRTEEPPDAFALHGEALRLFVEAGETIAACEDAAISAEKQLHRCGEVSSALALLDVTSMTNQEIGEELWRVLELWKPAVRTKKTAEVRDLLIAEHGRLLAEAATCAAEPFGRALVGLADAFERNYVALKAEKGLLDFDDLQTRALALFETRPDVREQCRELYRLVMVDEFQDTDDLQLRLVKCLAEQNLCTVGDERQSIYRFRGADVDVYLGHNADMSAAGAREFTLDENYRSHDDVLSFVNGLFGSDVLFGEGLLRLRHGRGEPPKPFVSEGTPRIDITVVHKVERRDGPSADVRLVEATELAGRLATLRDEHGVRPGQMVVLLRAYTHADQYAEALRERGFEALIVGGSRYFGASEVATLRAFIRAVANPHDEDALATLLASSLSRLSDDGLWILSHADSAQRGRAGLWASLENAESLLGESDAAAAVALRCAISHGRARAGRMPLSELLLRAVEETDFDLVLLADGDGGRQHYANVLKLARMADAFESAGGAGPAEFEEYLQAKETFKDHTTPATLADEETPAVRIMSIHASKGLEFPVVAVPELGARDVSDTGLVRMAARGGAVDMAVRLPSDWTTNQGANRTALFIELDEAEKAADQEERKRLFYVACTRAEEMLILSGSANLDKACDSSAAKSPLDWMRLALGEGLSLAPEEERADCMAQASVNVRRIDAEAWANARAEHEAGSSQPPKPGAELSSRLETRPKTEPAVALPGIPDGLGDRGDRHVAPSWSASRLSYSDLELFERCSLRFFAEKVLRVGTLDVARCGDPRRFGSAVHAVLQLAGADGGIPGRERIAAIARANELDTVGEAKLVASAERFLDSVLARELGDLRSVRREWPFALRLGDDADHFLLVGTIDAYGRSGADGLVVDYKTGESGSADELAERYLLQARCYALAALRDGCERVHVAFVRPEVIGADGQPQQIDFEFVSAEANDIEAEISAVRRRMTGEDFGSLAEWSDSVCRDCPVAGGVCPVPVPARP